MSPSRPAAVVVLAAGEGTRMRSATPKVLHDIGGRPCRPRAGRGPRARARALVVVVGTSATRSPRTSRGRIPTRSSRTRTSQGHRPRGACGLAALGDASQDGVRAGTVVVTYGDVPLLDPATLRDLVAGHEEPAAAVTVLTAEVADPTGYGRICATTPARSRRSSSTRTPPRTQRGDPRDQLRHLRLRRRGCSPTRWPDRHGQRPGRGCTSPTSWRSPRADGRRVGAVPAEDVWQIEGVNDRVQLAALGAELNRRMLDGVDARRRHRRRPGDHLDRRRRSSSSRTSPCCPAPSCTGAPRSRRGAEVGPDTTLIDCEVGRGRRRRPHARRPAPSIGAGRHGRPVRLPAAGHPARRARQDRHVRRDQERRDRRGSKVPHLSYVGDATIGEHANIGAATIFANYDGVAQAPHRRSATHVRIGSDTMFVAPVHDRGRRLHRGRLGHHRGRPAGRARRSARGRQRNIEGWVATPARRARRPAAAAERPRARERRPRPIGRRVRDEGRGRP